MKLLKFCIETEQTNEYIEQLCPLQPNQKYYTKQCYEEPCRYCGIDGCEFCNGIGIEYHWEEIIFKTGDIEVRKVSDIEVEEFADIFPKDDLYWMATDYKDKVEDFAEDLKEQNINTEYVFIVDYERITK